MEYVQRQTNNLRIINTMIIPKQNSNMDIHVHKSESQKVKLYILINVNRSDNCLFNFFLSKYPPKINMFKMDVRIYW